MQMKSKEYKQLKYFLSHAIISSAIVSWPKHFTHIQTFLNFKHWNTVLQLKYKLYVSLKAFERFSCDGHGHIDINIKSRIFEVFEIYPMKNVFDHCVENAFQLKWIEIVLLKSQN